ncbi:hypothetical protein CRX72_05190 [Pantoea sp. BRM17]|nr:hypothetical protein CRX72_05190 [Pantoea sp. BRM17]
MLTAIGNDRLHDEIYAKQVRALGQAGDVLLAISTRGNTRDIVKAVEAAVTRDMTIVALTGHDPQIAAAEALPDAISRAAMTLVQSLLNGHKILSCGNGASAANAQHFAASMINRFETERPSLPALALSSEAAAGSGALAADARPQF